MSLSTYSYSNDFIIMSETNGSVGVVIILLLNAFEQSAILPVSYVTCKASIIVCIIPFLYLLVLSYKYLTYLCNEKSH